MGFEIILNHFWTSFWTIFGPFLSLFLSYFLERFWRGFCRSRAVIARKLGPVWKSCSKGLSQSWPSKSSRSEMSRKPWKTYEKEHFLEGSSSPWDLKLFWITFWPVFGPFLDHFWASFWATFWRGFWEVFERFFTPREAISKKLGPVWQKPFRSRTRKRAKKELKKSTFWTKIMVFGGSKCPNPLGGTQRFDDIWWFWRFWSFWRSSTIKSEVRSQDRRSDIQDRRSDIQDRSRPSKSELRWIKAGYRDREPLGESKKRLENGGKQEEITIWRNTQIYQKKVQGLLLRENRQKDTETDKKKK